MIIIKLVGSTTNNQKIGLIILCVCKCNVILILHNPKDINPMRIPIKKQTEPIKIS